eukprot:5542656-Pyramimonas_sp.AAC.1
MGESYRTTRILDILAVVAGWKHSRFSNTSAWCTFMLPPRWPQKCMGRIDTPPTQLQGRGVGVYFRFRGISFYAVTLYYPPKPSDRNAMPTYVSCCVKLTRWASTSISKAPHSAIPFIMTDVNDGVGITKQDGQWQNTGEQAIGIGVTQET